jgi:hypothetical protein
MAAITFTMNNLTIDLSGVNGWIDTSSYTNLDPVDYVFKCRNNKTGQVLIYTCHANTTVAAPIPGFRRSKTDESELTFLGAVPPTA